MSVKKTLSFKARLILYNRGQILVLKQTKPKGGNYTLVGGDVERGEFAKAAVIREAYEEAGIILNPEDLSLVHVLHKIKRDQQRLILYFKANQWQGELRSMEPRKFKRVEWVDLDDLPDKLTETIKQVLKAYRRGKLYSEMTQ